MRRSVMQGGGVILGASAGNGNHMTPDDLNSEDPYKANYRKTRITHGDALARRMDVWTGHGGYYHERLAQVYKFPVSPGQRVIEIGCGQGDLLEEARERGLPMG